jgi:hypothetical protein
MPPSRIEVEKKKKKSNQCRENNKHIYIYDQSDGY